MQSVKNGLKINICDDEHIPVRTDLMRIARGSSVWIREYLLDSLSSATTAGGGGGGVVVSSPHYFRTLLKDWMVDPCGGNATKRAGSYILQAIHDEHALQKRAKELEKVQVDAEPE